MEWLMVVVFAACGWIFAGWAIKEGASLRADRNYMRGALGELLTEIQRLRNEQLDTQEAVEKIRKRVEELTSASK